MEKFRLLSLIVFCVITGNINSQNILTEEQKVLFQARQQVEEFQSSLSKVVNQGLRHDVRKENVINLLKLFIGEGEPYDYYDVELDKLVHNAGVKIHMSNLMNTSISSQLLKKYIYRLYNPETGTSIMQLDSGFTLDFVDVIHFIDAEKIGDHYECTAYYHLSMSSEHTKNQTKQIKKIKMILDYNPIIQLSNGKSIYTIKLGNIYCVNK